MPSKKKNKSTLKKRAAAKKGRSASSRKTKPARGKSAAVTRKSTAKSRTPKRAAKKKRSAKKKTSVRSVTPRLSAAPKSRGRLASEQEREKELREKDRLRAAARSGRQSGDLQGLFRKEGPDSESVDELVEEGNLFEAGAVADVEEADDSDEREVHTHEMPEDDVPEDYLDRD
jgi:hypothetical protein